VPGTVLSNCPGVAACNQDWDYEDPQYGRLFRNRSAGLLKVQDTNTWAKRVLDDGSDVGADPDELPEIRNLTVTPTNRSALFSWSVTNPIAHIPCVVEVNETPDFQAGRYAGELSDIATYHRQDADDAERYMRSESGIDRMITVGHTVPLNNLTTYYYRLQCGGDTRRGSFVTAATVEQPLTRTITRHIEDPSVRSMEVEYGVSFNRGDKAIIGSRFANAMCEPGNHCSVPIQLEQGTIVYYRWKELSESGAVVFTSDVGVLAADTGE
jgi:hypothetical protein